MSFRFILVLETITTISTLVLLFLFMDAIMQLEDVPYNLWVVVILQFFFRVKLFGLLWTALAHKNTLHLRNTAVFRLATTVRQFSRSQEGSGLR